MKKSLQFALSCAFLALVGSCGSTTAPQTSTQNSNFSSDGVVSFDNTIVNALYSGDEAVTARKIGKLWYIDLVAGKEDREISIDYRFLDCGILHQAFVQSKHIGLLDFSKSKVDTTILTQSDTITYTLPKETTTQIVIKPWKYRHGLVPHVATPTLPDTLTITSPDKNEIREALLPLPKSGIFKLDGYSVWDPSIIKVGDTYHMFCSRWSNDKTWYESEVIRATSKSLYGPYEFVELLLTPENHPWADRGVHNPKIIKTPKGYLLYHLGIPKKGHQTTGFAFSESIEGPWKVLESSVIPTNNPALVVHEDESVYVVGRFHRFNDKCVDGYVDVAMQAFRAPSLDGPFTSVAEPGVNILPNEFELEDPCIRYVNGKYHVLCTDWDGKVTGVQKAIVYYTSKDGRNYELYSQIPVWDQTDAIELEDGSKHYISQIERPDVYVDEDGDVTALLVGVIDREDEKGERGPNYIMIRPTKPFKFQ